MTVLVNGAGASAANPIAKSAPFEFRLVIPSMDAATIDGVWLDGATGLPGTNSIGASASPALGVTTRGNNGQYTHSTRTCNLGSNTGLSVGDIVWFNHGSITPGIGRIESLPGGGTSVVIAADENPFAADASTVAFQVGWRFVLTAGTAPSLSSAGGTQNFFKARASDSAGNQVGLEESVHYVKDLPVGALLAALQGLAYNSGSTTNDSTPTVSILPGFGASNGGITHIALANHGAQGVLNATWGDLGVTEKTFAQAIALGLTYTGGDGIKYGRLVLRTRSGSANGITLIDFTINLDTVGPTIQFVIVGR